ncbi:TIGR04219 family outer membrane beta-barrel protein [Glaciecola sp. 1036]|uniref:TIGR04219 family outer membrane beta-barrel protein n=1 Tax=Alteromonadaceae TaxID=72275 RepID=UPI003CFE2FE0
MKKSYLATVILATSGIAFSASADTVLGIYVGAQAWNMGVEGGFSQSDTIAEFGFEDETNANFYAALEHPIPLVPNLKVAQTTLDTSGGTTLSSTFTFGGEVYTADTVLETDVDLITRDFILYYEILDNNLASFDIGINVKQVDGEFLVADADSGRTATESFDGFIPMGYGRLAIGIPGTGLGAYAEGSFISIDDSSVTDYQVAVTYSFIESLALDLTLQAGYRSTEVDIEDLDDVYADLEFDGAFVGVEFHF